MSLVEIVVGLWRQLGRKLLEHTLQYTVDRFLLGRVAVPDSDEVRVEADREAYTADLVTWHKHRVSMVHSVSTTVHDWRS